MICTILYVAVALVITGMVNYEDINPNAALAQAFIDQGKDGYATLISAGAVAGLTTVVMTLLIGAVRVTFAMSRDSLLPHHFGHVSPKTGTPIRITLVIGTVVAFVASLTPVGKLEEMVNIGTLTAFSWCRSRSRSCARTVPTCSGRSRFPLSPFLPWLSAAICLFLMINLTTETWLRFLVWMAHGFAIYFAYGYRLAASARVRGSLPQTIALSRRACRHFSRSSAGPATSTRCCRLPARWPPRARGRGRGFQQPDAAGGGSRLPGTARPARDALPRARPRPDTAAIGDRPRRRGRVRGLRRRGCPASCPGRQRARPAPGARRGGA